jgi:GNAT superfamily N-acetyltransferase
MNPADLTGVMAVQSDCYEPGFLEPLEVLAQRWRASPSTAWVAVDPEGAVQAYLVGYRSELGRLTTLGGGFHPTADGDTLYLHDLAVAPRAAGTGLGPRLVQRALEEAERMGCGHSALVSVQGSREWWQRRGYHPITALDESARTALASYGAGAVYMAQALLTRPQQATGADAMLSLFQMPPPPGPHIPGTDPAPAASAHACETGPEAAARR